MFSVTMFVHWSEMLDENLGQFGWHPILPVVEFYSSIHKSLSLFLFGKENTDTASSSGL